MSDGAIDDALQRPMNETRVVTQKAGNYLLGVCYFHVSAVNWRVVELDA